MTPFQGKVALVTGATSGIGRATAIAFGKQGATVVVTGRREKAGRETLDMLRAGGGDGAFIQLDVSVEGDVMGVVREIVSRYSRLDCAANCAGNDIVDPLTEYSEADYDAISIPMSEGCSSASSTKSWRCATTAAPLSISVRSRRNCRPLGTASTMPARARRIRSPVPRTSRRRWWCRFCPGKRGALLEMCKPRTHTWKLFSPPVIGPAEVYITQQTSQCQMGKIDWLAQLAVVSLEPVKARIDFVPMIIDPNGPTSRLGPQPCLVTYQDYRFAHSLREGMICQHTPATRLVSRDQDITTG